MNVIRRKLNIIVFGTSTKAGRRFDVFLLWLILFSVLIVMLESVPEYGELFATEFAAIEWVITIIFTIEYFLRIWISPRPFRYIFSFWGVVDLLSILPTYLSIFFGGYHYLLLVRIFRLLRVFRIFKLARFSAEAKILREALKSSLHKVSIFLMSVVAIVTILGTVMYVVEGGKDGFTSIPQSIYWAVVTVTTVGYGDLVPHTIIGKFISSIAMITGYAIIAVPTGIVTVAMARSSEKRKKCTQCRENNELAAAFCNHCGNQFHISTDGDDEKLKA